MNDVKSVLKILLLFVPLPLFWALFDQQGSRWTFQATRMDGNIGFTQIKPDQMQVINPLLILIFIPIFDCGIYPLLSKIGIRRPLQKLTIGGILAGIAFMVSGFVELELEKTYPVFSQPSQSQVRIFNGVPCDFSIGLGNSGESALNALNVHQFTIEMERNSTRSVTLATSSPDCSSVNEVLNLQPGHSNSFFIFGESNSPNIQSFEDKIDKTKSGYPAVRVLSNLGPTRLIKFLNRKDGESKSIPSSSIEQFEILPSSYSVYVDDLKLDTDLDLLLGGVYTIIISKTTQGNVKLESHTITMPNSIHMLWLIPQFVIMTAGEVMFSVTGLEFAYSQAPTTMKSLLQACWLLTVAFGNIIVVVIAEAKIFQSQANEFFLFAIMMFVDMAIFALLAMRYQYVTNSDKKDDGDMENAIPIENTRKTFTNNAFQED